jgi:hypothetical protein
VPNVVSRLIDLPAVRPPAAHRVLRASCIRVIAFAEVLDQQQPVGIRKLADIRMPSASRAPDLGPMPFNLHDNGHARNIGFAQQQSLPGFRHPRRR